MWPTYFLPQSQANNILSYGYCKNSTSGDYTMALTPSSSMPQIRDGDYLIVWLYAGTSDADKFVFTPPTGWTILSGGSSKATSSVNNFMAIGKFYDSGDGTYTFTHEWYSNTTICLQAFAYRGISRRYPVDQNYTLGLANTDDATVPDHQILWGQQRRIHADSAIVAQAMVYRDSTSTPAIPFDATTYVGGNELLDGVVNGFAANMHVDLYHERASKAGLVNLVGGNVIEGGEVGTGPFGINNLYEYSSNDGTFYSSLLQIRGDGAAMEHYLGGINVSMQAGQKGYLLVKLGAETTVSTDYTWAVTVQAPDDSYIGTELATAQSGVPVGSPISPIIDPDWWFGMGAFYSGLPDYKSYFTGFCFTAPATGDYEIRLYPLQEDRTALSHNAGAAGPYYTNCGFYGAAFAIDRFPDFIETGPGGADNVESDGYIPLALWRCDPAVRAYQADTYNAGFVLNKAAASFRTPVLLQANPASLHPVMDSDVQISGSVQPRWHIAGGGGLYMYADRVLLPSYRLTENGADVPGKYYWEVTVNSANASTTRIGLTSEGGLRAFYEYDYTYGSGVGIYVRGDGDLIRYNKTSSAALTPLTAQTNWGVSPSEEVYGFALDIESGTFSIYRNGVLIWTGDISPDETHTPKMIFRAYGGLGVASEGTDDLTKIGFNFTGPFVHTKPTGYAAYDVFNDLS